MRKVLVDRRNHVRAILTDTLPYEVPLFFTNEPLYKLATENKDLDVLPKIIPRLINSNSPTKPFSYRVQKSGGGHRRLAVPHPNAQLQFARLYREFDAFIESVCSRSNYSLRFPSRVGSHFYKSQFADDSYSESIDPDPASFSTQRKWASSYFSYKDYAHVHKFFSSDEFSRLEQQYPLMLRVDIARCFESIYTHSISWAVRGKDFSKNNRDGFFFESQFDSRMRDANWGETNGIIIGPEVSRIFAEVIMQSVDLDIEGKLGTLKGRCAIRRYVDDFFVFAHDESDLRAIRDLITEAASKYNLHINEKKTETVRRPLISSFSVARQRVKSILNDFFQSARASLGDASGATTFARYAAENVIAEIRRIAKECNVDYSTLASPSLGVVSRSLNQIRRRFESGNEDKHQYGASIVYATLRITSFLFLADIRSATSHKVSKIFLDSSILFDRIGKGRRAFEGAISDFVRLGLEQAGVQQIAGPEILNILVAADAVCRNYRAVSEARLRMAVGVKEDWHLECGSLNYFELVAVLYLARSSNAFIRARDAVSKCIENKVRGLGHKLYIHAEETMLFFDYLSCPYIPETRRMDLLRDVSAACGCAIPPGDLGDQFRRISTSLHFVAWKGAENFQALLERRELQAAYDS